MEKLQEKKECNQYLGGLHKIAELRPLNKLYTMIGFLILLEGYHSISKSTDCKMQGEMQGKN